MLAVVNYGVGNLFSLAGSLKRLDIDAVITSDKKVIESAGRIILPGVGAFGEAAQKLAESGLDIVLKNEQKKGKPLLGICLGMQLLFEKSFEYGEHDGLGFVGGQVCPLSGDIKEDLKIPHMGWNSLKFKKKSQLFKYTNEGDYVYFVHSFYAKNCEKYTSAYAEYGIDVTAAVENGNVYGTQFHPEKSGGVGLKILKAFGEIV